MRLDMNEDDIQELVDEHGQELTINQLMDLYCEQQQEVIEEILSERRRKGQRNPSLEIPLGRCENIGTAAAVQRCNVILLQNPQRSKAIIIGKFLVKVAQKEKRFQ